MYTCVCRMYVDKSAVLAIALQLMIHNYDFN